MSFHVDFIEHVERETLVSVRAHQAQSGLLLGVGTVIEPEAMTNHVLELRPFWLLAQEMRKAKIVRMSGPQSQVFLDTPTAHGQDYRQWLRLPFPSLYLQLDQAMPFNGYSETLEGRPDFDAALRLAHSQEERERLQALKQVGDPLVRGALMYEDNARNDLTKTWGPEIVENVERFISVVFLMPIPDFLMNCHGMTLGIARDNTLKVSLRAEPATRARMTQWAVNTINFLSSPTIKLVQEHPPAALQKARQRRGKPPLPGWYVLAWRHQVKDYGRDNKITMKAWEHSYRYDVRGFQRTYRRGPMAGRVVWVKAHQRGLKHTLYKPAIREVVP